MPAMFGWFSDARTSASRWKRASRSWSAATDGGQDLDGDLALQLRVGRAIDLAHTSGANGGDHFIGPETGAGC